MNDPTFGSTEMVNKGLIKRASNSGLSMEKREEWMWPF